MLRSPRGFGSESAFDHTGREDGAHVTGRVRTISLGHSKTSHQRTRAPSTLLRPMPAFRIGTEHTVTVDQIEPQGLASARLPEGTLYIHGGAVPGDTLRVRVARKQRRTFEAEIV